MCQYAVAFLVLLLLTWLYLAKISHDSIISNAQIQLNIIDSNNVVSRVNLSDISSRNEGYKRKIKHHIPKFMLDLYHGGRNIRNDSVKADVVRSLTPVSADIIYGKNISSYFGDNHLLTFHVPTSKRDERLLNAELKVLTIVDLKTKVGIEKIIEVSVYDHSSANFVNLEKVHVFHSNNTWLTFNVTTPVINLLERNVRNRTLKIAISIASFEYSSDNLKLSLMPLSEDYEHDYPVLLLSYTLMNEDKGKDTSAASKRKKRSIEDDYEEETNSLWDDEVQKKYQNKKLKRIRNTCKKKPLYVNFAEINYDDWIVQPSGYEAYQCQGKCFYPVADHLNPTKHAIVQTLLHSVAPSRVSRSCCVPTRLESISVLYVDDNGVLTYRYAYKDMVVAECGCR